jgi:DNA-binding PadR family transcriptional regulator
MNDLLILSMLLPGPKYGYQLKREVGWMMGQSELHNNIVYPLLRRFLEEGWVNKKSVPGERGQTRQQYALTAEGRRTYFERINKFGENDASSQEALFLRVGVFEALAADSREAILSAREAFLQRRDQRLETLQQKMDLGKFGREIVGHMRKQIDMEKTWLRHLRRIAKVNGSSK